MIIRGVRAYGDNNGSLGHTGDFVLLFNPLIKYLQSTAVFGVELQMSEIYHEYSFDEADAKIDRLQSELEKLKLVQNVEYRENIMITHSSYYGPGFFPKFAGYIEDDWNELICFKKPYPDYSNIVALEYYKGDPCELRQKYIDLNFFMWFQNIDAFYWECFINDENVMDKLLNYLSKKRIRHELLNFEKDCRVF